MARANTYAIVMCVNSAFEPHYAVPRYSLHLNCEDAALDFKFRYLESIMPSGLFDQIIYFRENI